MKIFDLVLAVSVMVFIPIFTYVVTELRGDVIKAKQMNTNDQSKPRQCPAYCIEK